MGTAGAGLGSSGADHPGVEVNRRHGYIGYLKARLQNRKAAQTLRRPGAGQDEVVPRPGGRHVEDPPSLAFFEPSLLVPYQTVEGRLTLLFADVHRHAQFGVEGDRG